MRDLGEDLLRVFAPAELVIHPRQRGERVDLLRRILTVHRHVGLGHFEGPLPRVFVVAFDQHQRQRVRRREVARRLHVGVVEKLLGRRVVAGHAGDRAAHHAALEALGIELERVFRDHLGPLEVVLPEVPLRGREQHGGILRRFLDGRLDQLLGGVALLGVVVEAGHCELGLHGLLIELLRLAKLLERFLRLAQLKEHDAHALVRAGVVGVEVDPGLEMLLGEFPLLAGLGHGGAAGVAANVEVALPLGVFGVLAGEPRGFLEEHVGVGDAPILEGEVAHHEIGLGIRGKLDGAVFELGTGRAELVHAQPEHRHHHAGGRQLGVVALRALENGAAAVDIAVAKAVDGARHLLILGVVRHGLADQRLGRDLGPGLAGRQGGRGEHGCQDRHDHPAVESLPHRHVLVSLNWIGKPRPPEFPVLYL